ncbi:uncharacterized protein LOC62_05G006866 [Vanrija pseudolonga]|uniref:Uncharacterized protein n=1 Tax=Vanrija pseudolonga TaxID=143232 RepID=A0AAF1BNN1_9TREE|nr:hypothetical protein LOC62_05G006866 [Vanrija pseudolonga]
MAQHFTTTTAYCADADHATNAVPYPTPRLDDGPTTLLGLFGPCESTPPSACAAFPPSPPSFSSSLARRSASPPPRHARAPPAPLLLSCEWSPVVELDDELLPVPSPSMLRAPRIAPRELALSPTTRSWDVSRAGTPRSAAIPVPPIEGTRPPAMPRYSALGLEIASGSSPVRASAPSPSPPHCASRKRRLASASDIEYHRDVAQRVDEPELESRVSHWWRAVAAATSGGNNTPVRCSSSAHLPLQSWGHELSAALSMLDSPRSCTGALRCEPFARTPTPAT